MEPQDSDDGATRPPAIIAPRQAILDTILRGVRALAIPAATDWPAARLHFPDNDGQWKFSAVLVAIVPRSDPTILLTRRASGLKEYSSHVSFPGGRPEDIDSSVGATALREACEEILLDPGAVELVGCLPLHKTRKRNHAIFPVIGLASPAAAWQASPAEVDEIFEFPFSALLDPDLPRQYADGERAGAWYWAGQQHDIWGVTALILKSLAALASCPAGARASPSR
ncbi:putative Nudix hydrolase NudL [Achromobacter insuavis]|uniref:NUDIX hydrolase n=1 Tax=Achromobacter insuavis TaxID=1287735 RepID=UPI0014681D33|nr:CoA pyrophosphatase [Achromobacter insuavis]CAB3883958.1 putative Nudix hydrolase NudL [Achromobacter insuavis]